MDVFKKTVTNERFKNEFPNFEFTNLNEGLKLTYSWFKKIIQLLENKFSLLIFYFSFNFKYSTCILSLTSIANFFNPNVA